MLIIFTPFIAHSFTHLPLLKNPVNTTLRTIVSLQLFPSNSKQQPNQAMTTYGTIPTSSSPGTNLEFITRAKQRIKTGLGTRRPWKIMFNLRSFSLPGGFADAISRIRTNIAYFQMNYAMVALLVLFLSLLWHPISLIVFVVLMAAWLFLYFLRDEPLVIFGRVVSDSVVLGVMAVLTVVLLLLTDATGNILVALLIAVVLVVVHAAFRRTDDLFFDEEEAAALAHPGGSGASS